MSSRSDLALSSRSRTLRASILNDLGVDECWPWRGFVDNSGYGRAYEPGTRRIMRAHRLVWTLLVGPLGDDDVLDHMCHDPSACTAADECPHRSCVNPAHLRRTDIASNTMRGNSPTALNSQRTRCLNGHAFDDVNTVYRSGGGRACRACGIERSRAARAAAGKKPRLARRTVTPDELRKDA